MSKNWREVYKDKIVTADEAVKQIKSGDRLIFSHACGEAQEITDALLRNKESYEKVEIIHLVPMGKGEYAQEENQKYFYHNSFFGGGSTRKAINGTYGDFTPSFFFEIPNLFRKNGKLPLDVAIIQVSAPDEHGYCSYGISCDYTKGAAENAKIVIAQVNKYMPRTLGENFIHLSAIDSIVEYDQPILQLNPPKIGEVQKKIGEYCAGLIQDGDTLQLGIGAIPDAVLTFLKEKKHLGIHSEMISDGVVDLILAGVIDNSQKTIHKNKCIVSFLMGSQKLYDYVHNNPGVELYPVDYVNHPFVIAQNDNMVSINSALQVDLMGQVNAESMGAKQFSGTGGQVDFVRGAAMSKGGRSIIAMPSTAAKGTISKIVMNLDVGATVTTSRNDVDYIITEYGIAELKGKTLRERAKALIAIAHPDFREQLTKQALEKFQRLE
ncbi:4-hydroxybutyrate CoA transferase [Fusobacterium necrophorum DAB]|uniref:acetyl-CoA hydrolase/transferase family protein n=1 Tax=Fusobacterium necrophorum TaxID=859 RepID=UPI00046201EC|nr:acetyl-CoA hydrolase/transferase C-terminal domain-containing protein [Fusobacterium necrophorum]KDE70915.1 4-hydroxybutyrate CoA transferase [Fusobacterium necrophorum DAB]